MNTYRISVYEYHRDGEIHVGTQEELTEATGVAKGNLHLYSEKIGTRHMKLKAVNKKTGEVQDRKSTRLNSSHIEESRMPSSA